ESLAGAGPEAVQQHVGLGGQLQQRVGPRLDVQVDDSLPAVQQVTVLGRHLQTAGAPHPDQVGTQIREHHARMRARSDAAEFDDPHAGQGPPANHYGYLPFFTFSTCVRNSWVAASIVPFTARLRTKPGSGTLGSTVTSNLTSVSSPLGTRMYF